MRRRRGGLLMYNTVILATGTYTISFFGMKRGEERLFEVLKTRREPEARVSQHRAAFVLPVHRLQLYDQGDTIIDLRNLSSGGVVGPVSGTGGLPTPFAQDAMPLHLLRGQQWAACHTQERQTSSRLPTRQAVSPRDVRDSRIE